MKNKYVILGGGGSFAIHTAFYLLKQNDTDSVTGIGRNLLRPEMFSLNIEKEKKYSYLTYHLTYEQDLMLEKIDKIEPNIIVCYAAQVEGAVSWKNSWRFFETNSMGLSKLTENLMKKKYLKRFIQIGTSELYGSVNSPAKEDSPVFPSSPYAASKLAFDFYLLSVFKYLNFPMNIIRPSNAYCPGQLPHRVIPRAIISGLCKEKLPLHGGGRAEKSYIHVRDLAKAIYLVAQKGRLGEIYNVGPDNPTSIKEVIQRVANSLNMKFEDLCKITEDRLGQDSKYWLDSSKIKSLGWKQTISWDEGLKEMREWGEKYINQLKLYPKDYVMRG